MELSLVTLLLVLLGSASANFFEPFNVSYDHRALIIDGRRRMLISAGIHYPRATSEMWPGLIAKSKEGGADVIQTYVFWNVHEPIRGQYDFEGRHDLVKFAKLVATSGLYLHLRIGPYVCAEWNFGGFPVWLRDIPGIKFRTDNEQFKNEMQRFVKKIVYMMEEEMLLSWQGGPIILMQIENEYGNIEGSYGKAGKEYIKWAAEMALGLNAGVPWVMCRQTDAPETIIDTCNAFYCDGFKPNSYKKPVLWTEDWNGWYASWGGRLPHRPVEDNAFAIARFFQRGGSFHNYYMFFGGTNFGRTAGGPLQITSYDYDAPIDEYGLLSFPKWGHLKDLHAAIRLCEPALVAVDVGPQYTKLGPMQEAHIYSTTRIDLNSSISNDITCCAFLANIDEHRTVILKFLGQDYSLPPWSVSILPDCKHVVFNTAKVTSQISIKTTKDSQNSHEISESGDISLRKDSYISENWASFKEPIGRWEYQSFTAEGILEHLNVTKDVSDYLWYLTRVNISKEDISFLEKSQNLPSLEIDQVRDVVRVFVNGELEGSKVGKWVRMEQPIHLIQGFNDIAVVSETVGLQNYGAFLEKDGAGLKGQIKLSGLKYGKMDLSKSIWSYQVGLMGEFKKIYSPNDHGSVSWTDLTIDCIPSAFTWYRTFFDSPSGNDPVALYLGSMGKGQAWINGHGIGRYWSIVSPKNGCPKCNYPGAYNENKCMTNCGKPTQDRYHIPRSWLKPSKNLLVMFEETGGNPFEIELELHTTSTICSKVSESDYPPLSIWSSPDFKRDKSYLSVVAPELHLQCDDGHVITNITFASFGNPKGSCQHFSIGKCHAQSSLSVVSEACLRRSSCKISVSITTFGDPCRGVLKTLMVEAKCTSLITVSSL